MTTDAERLERAQRERERIKLAYPDEFADGAKRAFTGDHLYPSCFAAWSLGKRNAWFAGFNVGYCDRARARLERDTHG
jgi:hypothetical protein